MGGELAEHAETVRCRLESRAGTEACSGVVGTGGHFTRLRPNSATGKQCLATSTVSAGNERLAIRSFATD